MAKGKISDSKAKKEDLHLIGELLAQAKVIAIKYYGLTSKSLGITGEIGEYEAALKLGCTLQTARTPGHDIIDCDNNRVQVKTRCIRDKKSQRVPTIIKSEEKKEWDYVVLVLLDPNYEVIEILRADKNTVEEHLSKPRPKGGKARRDMPISEFKIISTVVWPNSKRSRKNTIQ